MYIEEFPHCCTLDIAVSFGQSNTAEGGYEFPEVDEIKTYLLNQMRLSYRDGNAAMFVSTNNEQENVNKVLLELGFDSTNWMTKRNHSETKVRVWWLQYDKNREILLD